MNSLRALLAISALGGWLLVGPVSSYAVPLTDLFQGQTITADDKLFSNFSLISQQVVNGGFANLNLIDVTPLVDDPLNPGIKFTAPPFPADNPALGVPFGHTGLSSVTVIFTFDVQTTNGRPLIKDNSLLLSDFVFDSGPNAFIQIDELVFDAAGNRLGEKSVIARPGEQAGAGNPNHFDTADFTPQSLVHVRKTINIVGPGDNDGAFVLMFEQRFSQVPEPSGLALAAATGLCLLVGRWRLGGDDANCVQWARQNSNL